MINTIKATINLTNVCLDEVDLGNGVIYRGDDLATTLEIKAPINSNAYVLLACITPNGRNLGPFNADNTTSTSSATTYEFLLTKENGYNFAVGRTELIVYYCVVNTNSSISKKAIGSICVDVKKGVSVDDEATFIIGDTTDADAVLTDLNTKMDNLINQVATFSTQLSNKLDKVNGRVTLNNSGVLFTSRVELDTNYSELVQGTQGILNTVDSSTSTCEDEIHSDRAICTITDKNSSNSTETKQTANYVTIKATDGTNTNTLAVTPQSVNINGKDVVAEDDLTAETTARQNADGTLQTNIDNESLARGNADTLLQAHIDASGHKIEILKDLSTYEYTFVLYDANDNVLSSQLIDLPIEAMIVNVSYDATNKDLIITLQNGTTLNVPLDDIVSGLASQDWVNTQLNTKANASTTYTKSEVDAKLDAEKNYTDNIYTLATNNIAGKDTSTNILAKSSNSGIWVGTDTGHWYYWNGTQYVDGGVYQATEIPDGSITYKKTDFINGIINVLDFNDTSNIIKSGYYCTDSNYPNGTANSGYAFVRCKVKPNTTYTIRGWFYFALINSNGLFTYSTNLGQSQLVNKTFTTGSDTEYILFNTTPSVLYTTMVVEGATYPTNYIPYGEYYEFKGYQIYAKKDEVETIEKYYVGANKQYTTFTQCIRALANNTNKKIIYIDEGTYNIFNEIGGSEYALSIPSGTSWFECNDIIPDNTTIIGLGYVIFNFMPTSDEIGNIADDLLSPINIQGNVSIENITINADNCRYCIHDETGDGYNNSVKSYKNVKCFKYSSDGLGKPQAYASGFYKGVSYNFENCYFQAPVECMSFHDRNYNGGNININNCAFVSTSGASSNYSIRFGNVAYSQKHHKVYINNCYISSRLYINAENGNETINSYDLQVIGCNNPTIDIQSILTTNIYVPKVYN